MSIALKFGDLLNPKQLSGFIYLDAVTAYSKSYDGRVTDHPLESGVSITDHFVSENPKFKITGVISGVDLSPIPLQVFMDNELPMNSQKSVAQPVQVSNLGSGLSRFLPDSISQFLPSTGLNVIGGTEREDYREMVETFFETLMSGLQYNDDRKSFESRVTLATIYEMKGSSFGRSYANCVLTNYQLSENVESGEGLFLELSFEQVRFADSEVAEAPKPAKKTPTARGTAGSKDKGTAKPTEDVKPTSAPAPDKPRFIDPTPN